MKSNVTVSIETNVLELAKIKCRDTNVKLSNIIESQLKSWAYQPDTLDIYVTEREIIEEIKKLDEQKASLSAQQQELKAKHKLMEKEEGKVVWSSE